MKMLGIELCLSQDVFGHKTILIYTVQPILEVVLLLKSFCLYIMIKKDLNIFTEKLILMNIVNKKCKLKKMDIEKLKVSEKNLYSFIKIEMVGL